MADNFDEAESGITDIDTERERQKQMQKLKELEKRKQQRRSSSMNNLSGWMTPIERPIAHCPRGLEYLVDLDQVIIKHEPFIVATGDCNNRFSIRNRGGKQIFYAFEQSDCCSRKFCGTRRHFTISVSNRDLKHSTPLQMCGTCSSCCRDEISITMADGALLGYVYRAFSLVRSRYILYDARKYPRYEIKGPCMCCQGRGEFTVTEMFINKKVGSIHKIMSLASTVSGTPPSSSITITFPKAIDVRLKATLIGVVFLVDYMFFE